MGLIGLLTRLSSSSFIFVEILLSSCSGGSRSGGAGGSTGGASGSGNGSSFCSAGS